MAALVAPMFVMMGSPASAGTGANWIWLDSNGNGYVAGIFKHEGEIFSVKDVRADGYSGVLEWKVGSGGTVRKLWDSRSASASGYVTYNAEIAEGAAVYMRLCRGNASNGSIHDCAPGGWMKRIA
ncbi:hypothetical protein [Aeromicrobium sp. P5_D10]